MRVKGLEPPRPKTPDPKSGASASSATPATNDIVLIWREIVNNSMIKTSKFNKKVPNLHQ